MSARPYALNETITLLKDFKNKALGLENTKSWITDE
jgi:hypothetical protein